MSIVIERTDGHMCTQSHKGKRGWRKRFNYYNYRSRQKRFKTLGALHIRHAHIIIYLNAITIIIHMIKEYCL